MVPFAFGVASSSALMVRTMRSPVSSAARIISAEIPPPNNAGRARRPIRARARCRSRLAGDVGERERRLDHVGVVGGGRRRLRFAGAIGVQQPPVLSHPCTDEIEGALGRLEPIRRARTRRRPWRARRSSARSSRRAPCRRSLGGRAPRGARAASPASRRAAPRWSASRKLERLSRLRMLWPSKLPSGVTS